MYVLMKLGVLVVLVGLLVVTVPLRTALASHTVHGNQWYWEQWAYSPLTPVNAYDCVTQHNAIAGAANEWNATGLVNVVTQTGVCDYNADGILWRASANQYKSEVRPVQILVQDGVLEPGPQPGNLMYKAVRISIYLGYGLPDGDSTCAGYYSPCDVATHEMGHALGLQDHYSADAVDACTLNPGGPSCFTYGPAGTTIMDYPHVTDIAAHDFDDLYLKYRNAPFSSYPFTAAAANFHIIGFQWGDRSHNEQYVELFEKPFGYSNYYYLTVFPKNATAWLKTDLSPGWGYCYYNRNIDSWAHIGANSGESCTVTPHAVQNVNGYFGGGYNYTLCWDQPAAGSGVASYRVLLRWFNGTNAVTYSFDVVNLNTACFGRVGFSSGVQPTGWYHISVAGCTIDGVCSQYWDMTNPYADAVYLPCYGGNGYCAYSPAAPNNWYHSH